jgi:hypothetical protein
MFYLPLLASWSETGSLLRSERIAATETTQHRKLKQKHDETLSCAHASPSYSNFSLHLSNITPCDLFSCSSSVLTLK